MYNSRLNILPVRHVWNADGSTDASATAAPATTLGGAVFGKSGCTTCQKKRMACVAGGILLGAVLTYIFVKKSPAKAD